MTIDDHLVEEGQRVVLEHRAALGPLVQLGDRLLAALGEAEEAGQHAGAEDQPLRGVGVDRLGAGDDAEDEQARDRHHVDDHDLLEPEAVGELGGAVAGDHQPDLPVDGREGERQRADRERDRHAPRGALGELPGGDRPVALLRVRAVELDVVEVVDQIAGAGDRAEGDEGERRVAERADVVELAREEHARRRRGRS